MYPGLVMHSSLSAQCVHLPLLQVRTHHACGVVPVLIYAFRGRKHAMLPALQLRARIEILTALHILCLLMQLGVAGGGAREARRSRAHLSMLVMPCW